jgi:hypothetical protein
MIAQELVDRFRNILMNEDTDCGEEILCTIIAKNCAIVAADFFITDEEEYEYFINQIKEI